MKRKPKDGYGYLFHYPINKKRPKLPKPQEELENKCSNLAFW